MKCFELIHCRLFSVLSDWVVVLSKHYTFNHGTLTQIMCETMTYRFGYTICNRLYLYTHSHVRPARVRTRLQKVRFFIQHKLWRLSVIYISKVWACSDKACGELMNVIMNE